MGAMYFNNSAAWMRSDIWVQVMSKFNCHCYTMTNNGADPVVLLVDNCPAHCIPPAAKPWKCGSLVGFRMTNVLVIFFKANCTSMVQPLDAGCIQTVKALFRKRHMSWILDQLNHAQPGVAPVLRCSVRQAIE